MKKIVLGLILIALLAATGCAALTASAQDGGGTASPTPAAQAPAWLGLEIADVNPRLAAQLGIDLGVMVINVLKDSPAAQAGFQKGDIILKVNGQAVNSVPDLQGIVKGLRPGDALQVEVRRGNATLTLTPTLGQRPPPQVPEAGLPLLPELGGIPLDQLFSHLWSGRLLLSDKDGQPVTVELVAGVVASVTEGAVTVTPNDGSGDKTFSISQDTKVPATLKVGDRVVAVTVNGQTRLIAPAGNAAGLLPRLKGWKGMPFLRPGPGPLSPHPGLPLPARVAVGQVKEISDTGLVLTAGEKEIQVVFTSDTKFRGREEGAKPQPGDRVQVVGKPNDEGALVAAQVVVLPQEAAPKALRERVHGWREKMRGPGPGRFLPGPGPQPLTLPGTSPLSQPGSYQ